MSFYPLVGVPPIAPPVAPPTPASPPIAPPSNGGLAPVPSGTPPFGQKQYQNQQDNYLNGNFPDITGGNPFFRLPPIFVPPTSEPDKDLDLFAPPTGNFDYTKPPVAPPSSSLPPTSPPMSTPSSLAKPPFRGGQDENASYRVGIKRSYEGGSDPVFYINAAGRISGIRRDSYGTNANFFYLIYGGVLGNAVTQGITENEAASTTVVIVSVTKLGGAPDTGGDPPAVGGDPRGRGNFLPPPPTYYEPDLQPPSVPTDNSPLAPSKSGTPNSPLAPSPSGSPTGSPSTSSNTGGSPATSGSPSGSPSSSPSGSSPSGGTKDIGGINPTTSDPKKIGSPLIFPSGENPTNFKPTEYPPTVTPPATDPNKPNPDIYTPSQPANRPTELNPDLQKLKDQNDENKALLQNLPFLIPAILASDAPFNAKQKQNAKEAVCEESQPDQCIHNAVKRNTDDVTDNVNAKDLENKALFAEILAQFAILFNQGLTILAKIKTFAESTVFTAAINTMTFVTTVHNAAMLSRDIGTTLIDTLGNALTVFGLKLKNADTGADISLSEAIGQGTEQLLKNMLGVTTYTELTQRWATANRIYQAGMNVLSTTQSLLDSARSLNEQTGNNVGRIGNALKLNGLVRENEYPMMSENNTQANTFMNRLEATSNAVGVISSITGEVLSIQEQVTELQTNRAEFEKALKEKPEKAAVENEPIRDSEAAKKVNSLWTISDFAIVKSTEEEVEN